MFLGYDLLGMIIITIVPKTVLVFLYCISRHFIALGMHISINEQGVTRAC
jgi:hypothetical protein